MSSLCKRRFASALFAVVLLVSGYATNLFAQDGPLAVPVEGEPFAAAFVGSDGDWNITFQTDAGRREVAAADLVRWGTAPELEGEPLIVMADGGVLIADVREIDGERLIANSVLFGEVELPLARVRGVMFGPPSERLERDRLLDRILRSTGSRDRLLLENGDVVEGLFAGGRRPVQGPPAADQTPRMETLAVQVEDGVAEIPVERVAALLFNPSLVETPAPSGLRSWIGFEDDGVLLVEKVESSGGLTTLHLPGGVRLRTDDEGFQTTVQFLQPLGGRAKYLSDLDPLGYRHIPYLTLEWPYGRDRNVLGGRLRSGGRIYAKGLGMHSTSRLAYRLDGEHERLEAELALDDSAGREGSVIYRIYTTDGGEWRPAFESPIIRGGDPPLPISVDLAGAKAIALIVEHADRGDVQDHANWLDARLE